MERLDCERYWEDQICKDRHRFAEFQSCLERNPRERIYDALKTYGHKTLLDVGCGLAIDYEYCRDIQIEYSGVDITESFVLTAQQKYPGVEIKVGRIQDLPFENEEKDIVMVRSVFEHLPEFEPALTELTRVAKHLVVIGWFLPPTDEEEIVLFKKQKGGSVYRNIYSKTRVAKAFKDNNLEIIEKIIIEKEDSSRNYMETWVCRK